MHSPLQLVLPQVGAQLLQHDLHRELDHAVRHAIRSLSHRNHRHPSSRERVPAIPFGKKEQSHDTNRVRLRNERHTRSQTRKRVEFSEVDQRKKTREDARIGPTGGKTFTAVMGLRRTWKRSRTRRGPCSSSRENSSVDRTSASFMISPRPLMMLRSSCTRASRQKKRTKQTRQQRRRAGAVEEAHEQQEKREQQTSCSMSVCSRKSLRWHAFWNNGSSALRTRHHPQPDARVREQKKS